MFFKFMSSTCPFLFHPRRGSSFSTFPHREYKSETRTRMNNAFEDSSLLLITFAKKPHWIEEKDSLPVPYHMSLNDALAFPTGLQQALAGFWPGPEKSREHSKHRKDHFLPRRASSPLHLRWLLPQSNATYCPCPAGTVLCPSTLTTATA